MEVSETKYGPNKKRKVENKKNGKVKKKKWSGFVLLRTLFQALLTEWVGGHLFFVQIGTLKFISDQCIHL